MRTSPVPVSLNDRSAILDVLRGFAIFGIFMANSNVFSGFAYLNDDMKAHLFTHRSDGWLNFLSTMLVEGKFYSLFSLLFGIGFSIILIRNEEKGINPFKIFYRRLFILLVLGAAHLLLLWEGDILFLYALVGMLLPLFRKCSDKALLVWATILILSPILIDVIKVCLHRSPSDFLFNIAQRIDVHNGIPTDDNYAYYLYKPGSGYPEILKWCQSGFFYRYEYIIGSNRIPKVLGMFLIGLYVGRKMIYAKLEENRSLLKKIQLWGFVIGIPASIAMAYFEEDGYSIPRNAWGLADTFFYAISVVPLSLAYTSSLCLLWIKIKGKKLLTPLAAVGRMALSNYILQTILAIILYYNLGFGLGTRFGPTLYIPIVIGVYIMQVLLSNLWFRYFEYGPLEWIWRQLTYGKRLPLIKKKQA